MPVRYDFDREFSKVCQAHGHDPKAILSEAFHHGVVVKEPRFFLVAFLTEDPEGGQCWLVWWLDVNPLVRGTGFREIIARVLPLMPWITRRVAFARMRDSSRTLRYYSTERLCRVFIGREGT